MLVPFFIVAVVAPLALQYVEDNSSWIGTEFWTLILANCAMFACLAVALNLAVGYAGLLNLGFIAFFGIGSYTYSLVASDQIHQHLPLWAALVVVVLVSLAFALLVGIPGLRLRGDYLAIFTLGFGLIMNDIIVDLDRPPVLAGHQFGPDNLNLTGGSNGIHGVASFNLPTSVPLIGDIPHSRMYYWIFIGFLALSIFCMLRWRHTRTGRAWLAVREDELAARAMGVNTFKYRLLAFSLSAVMAGIVGMIDAAFINNAFPGNFAVQQTVTVFIMMILGGLGSLPGAVLGAVGFTVPPYLLQDFVSYKYLIIAVVLIAVMVLRPEGLLGTVSVRPRKAFGGTTELLTAESADDDADLSRAMDAPDADVETASGAIVASGDGP
ncbi:MAG: branched-chain amino acid ABC transporter permease [Candidatus Dormibacteraeota bacterium]|uniref:Branched-chain amino acid ABC transporter permease n=1 Tax=Candidatus Aeolococcus gillhamiae TaxID=3127015 RepID=A0A934JTS0_9BACT|nr:branched-chain amino acid ABC transporter permease [Candidatus Dormibacteraeota bacterium]